MRNLTNMLLEKSLSVKSVANMGIELQKYIHFDYTYDEVVYNYVGDYLDYPRKM